MISYMINGTEFPEIDPYSIAEYIEKVQGPAKGVAMSGSDIFDTVKVKECFSAKIGYITEEKYNTLKALSKNDEVTVKKTETETGDTSLKVMTMAVGRAQIVHLLGGGMAYKNITLDFKER